MNIQNKINNNVELFNEIHEIAKQKTLNDLGITDEIVAAAEYSDDVELTEQGNAYKTLLALNIQSIFEELNLYQREEKNSTTKNFITDPVKAQIIKYYLIAIVLMSLIVPYQVVYKTSTRFHGYEFIFDSPKMNSYPALWSAEISFERLILEFIAISAVAGIMYITKCKSKS